MRIKTFSSLSNNGLDRKVNEFLRGFPHEILDIKFSNTLYFYSCMVIYKED